MKYIFLLLSTLLLFSCTTTYQTTYSTYDEVYDTYTPPVESSDVIEDEPVNIYFNVIDYDLWTYRYPNYRRYWFYNYNYSYWSIYSNNWCLYNYPLNYWNQGYNWNYYYWGPYNYNYYNNYWYSNNWYSNNFYNNFYYTNNHYNYYTNHHRPFYYGPRSGIQTLNRRPLVSPKTEQKKPKPIDRPKQDSYIHSNPNHTPIKEDKPQRFESIDIRTKEPVRTQQTKPQTPQRTQQTKPQTPQRTQPSRPQIQQNKPQTPQRNNQIKPQTQKNKPR